jgi:dTDP-4-dehydrorhamnose reductase
MGYWIVLGARGALGSDLMERLSPNVLGFDREEFDLVDEAAMRRALEAQSVRGVINTAAFHHVPQCEDEPGRAFDVNAVAVARLARLCREHQWPLCHISTDYVFDGTKGRPYTEEDLPRPLSVYATSKLAGEHLAWQTWQQTLIVRSSGLYGVVPTRAKGGNFLTSILRQALSGSALKIVNDEVVAPTATAQLARMIVLLMQKKASGWYHVTHSGATTWAGFAKAFFTAMDMRVTIEEVSSAFFPSSVRRPPYSILDSGKAEKKLGVTMMDWETALKAFVAQHREGLMAFARHSR